MQLCRNHSYQHLKGLLFILMFVAAFAFAYTGTPHSVFGSLEYSDGSKPAGVTFTAYITVRPGEVLTQDSTGCGYDSQTGQWYVQCANFPTGWSAGEGLHVDFEDNTGIPGSVEVILTNNPVDQAPLTVLARDSYPITIQTVPEGLDVTVDGTVYTTPQIFTWEEGAVHTISTPTPQYVDAQSRYEFVSWSHGQSRTHDFTMPSSSATLTATFNIQYLLSVVSDYGSPAGGGWYNAGDAAHITVEAEVFQDTVRKQVFTGWSGEGNGSYTGPLRDRTITVNNPVTETALWTPYFYLATSVQPSTGGTMIPAPPGDWIESAARPVVRAFADTSSGYEFTHWSGDLNSITNPDTIPMTGPLSVTAHFYKPQTDFTAPFLQSCMPGPGAVLAPRNGPVSFLIIDPAPGSGVSVNDLSVGCNGVLLIEEGIDRSAGQAVLSPYATGFRFTYQPVPYFAEGDTVDVTVQMQDKAVIPNFADSAYAFIVGPSSLISPHIYRIPPRGVSFEDAFSGIQFAIPQNALLDTLDLVVGRVDELFSMPDTLQPVGTSYYLGPHGFRFNADITLALPYSESDLSEAGVAHPMELPVFLFSIVSGHWGRLPIARYTSEDIYVDTRDLGYATYVRISPQSSLDDTKRSNDIIYSFSANYPNPFNQSTVITFTLPENGSITLGVYNNLGRKVRDVYSGLCKSGRHRFTWNGCDNQGRPLSSGIYLMVLRNEKGWVKTRKAVLTR